MDNKKRTENFIHIRDQLESENYRGKQVIISIVKANVMALVTSLPLAVLCCVLFFLMYPLRLQEQSVLWPLLFLAVMLVCIFAHEFLHGLVWSFACKGRWKSIHLGVMWKKLTPYCCCMEPLSFGRYLLGCLMPLLVLGLGITVIAILSGSLFWLSIGVFNIVAAGGDTTIALMLLRHRDALIFDDPTECGFWAFTKKQSSQTA